MKDRNKATAPSPDSNDVKVYDLTPEMALADQDKFKIINLINTLDEKESKPISKAPAQPQVQQAAPLAKEERLAGPEEVPLVVKKKTETTPEPEQSSHALEIKEDASEPSSASTVIEKEVDAAFDAAEALSSTDDDQLLDDMTNLTEMVDNAIQSSEDKNLAEEDSPPSNQIEDLLEADKEEMGEPLPLDFDEEQLAADAAALESALSADDGMDEAIELTDIVEPAEPEAGNLDQADDAIIELTETVSPEELHVSDGVLIDEEIIELTEVVDPAEWKAAAALDPDEAIIELTEIVDPDEFEAAGAQGEADEDIIELTEIVDPAEFEAAVAQGEADEDIIELTDIVDPAELKNLADGQKEDGIIELTDILGRQSSKTTAGGSDKAPSELEKDEHLIRLSDVLNRKDKPGKTAPTSKDAADEESPE